MKYSEIIKLDFGELNSLLKSIRNELLDLKLVHSVSSIENPMLIRSKRKDIAKIKMVLNQLVSTKLLSNDK